MLADWLGGDFEEKILFSGEIYASRRIDSMKFATAPQPASYTFAPDIHWG
jgi:hypothetical protein